MKRAKKVLAVAAAAALVPAGAAQAKTLRGTVVGEPAVHGSKAVVPVLLTSSSAKALHARSVLSKVVVPVHRGLRARTGALAPGALRIGDRVRASLRRGAKPARPSVSVLRVLRRGPVASFAAITGSRDGAASAATSAIDAVAGLAASTGAIVGPVVPTGGDPDDLARLRTDLLGLRADLNDLSAGLRRTADGIGVTVAAITADRPATGARRDVVMRQQAPLLARLGTAAGDARASATALDGGVARLDETINAVGGVSDPALAVQSTGAVTDVLYAILDLLRAIDVP